MSYDPAHHIHVVIVGDGGVGKSSITLSLMRRDFSEEYDPTIEDSYTVTLNVDGQDYTIELHDCAGQEEYRGLWQEDTVRQGDAFILTYSIASSASFDAIPEFLHIIRKVKHQDENPSTNNAKTNNPFVYMLMGNKSDLPPDQRQVPARTALQYAHMGGGLFFETSAKQRVNIDPAFTALVRAVVRSRKAEAEWKRTRKAGRGNLGGYFNPNVGLLEDDGGRNSRSDSGFDERGCGLQVNSVGGGGSNGLRIGKTPTTGLSGNKSLAMDRRKSMSIGGLGRHPNTVGTHYDNEKGGRGGEEAGCCGGCVVV